MAPSIDIDTCPSPAFCIDPPVASLVAAEDPEFGIDPEDLQETISCAGVCVGSFPPNRSDAFAGIAIFPPVASLVAAVVSALGAVDGDVSCTLTGSGVVSGSGIVTGSRARTASSSDFASGTSC